MRILLFILPVLLAGCASDHVAYSPYVGQQQEWKTAPGAFMNQVDGIPIYRGWPSQPYSVLGQMVINVRIHDHQLAWFVKSHGGDAVIITNSRMINGGSISTGGSSSSYFVGNSIQTYNSPTFSAPVHIAFETALLIKFRGTNSTTIDTRN